jgi:hypothetical protein
MKKRARSTKKAAGKINGMIDFHFDNISYQIDPSRRKVYRQWIEVETARTSLIMGAFHQSQAQARKAV